MPDRLEALHRRIDDLTDSDGDYAVVCPLSGKRPVPVRGKSFPSPDAAERAVDLVEEYRAVLREVDPHLENLPLGAVEVTADPLRLAFDADGSSERGEGSRSRKNGSFGRRNGTPTRRPDRQPSRSITLFGEGDAEWLRMERAAVVTVREDGEPLDDAVVEQQLNVEF